MTILSWADAHFSAAHQARDGGPIHGHTWRVRAYWNYTGASILQLQAELQMAVRNYDHSTLPGALTRAEDLAVAIGETVGAERVDVWREAEGLGASWTR